MTAEQRQAAQLFEDYVQQPENQARVLQFGFRPGNTSVAIGDPIVTANGVDPNQPQNVLDVPEPDVLVKVLDTWERQRKAARVLLVIDVSGSMGDPASQDSDATKLELARDAAITALDQFKDADDVGCGSSRPTSTRPAPPRSTSSPWRRWTRASGPGSRTRSSR